MKIALVPNPEKLDAMAAARQLTELLRGRGVVETLLQPKHAQLASFAPDLVIVLGGDGSILSIAQEMVGIRALVAGINFGKLGYLAAFSLEQFLEHLEEILAGKAPVTERLMLQGEIYPHDAAVLGVRGLTALRGTGPIMKGVGGSMMW